jgi:hypothetical protein
MWKMRTSHKIIVGKPERKIPFRRHELKFEENIRTGVREICCEGLHWVHAAHDRDQWRAVVNTVMNLRVI